MHCLNGCVPIRFSTYLKQTDQQLYREYRLGVLKSSEDDFNNVKSGGSHVTASKLQQTGNVMDIFGGLFDKLPKLSNLPKEHPARLYYASRKLPANALDRFYFTEDFNAWSQTVNSRQELSDTSYPGIVIPLIDKDKNEFGYQCRFFDGPIRYKTIMVDDKQTKCYGMNLINFSKKINVFEGVFDSLYLNNSIASLDSSLDTTCDKLSSIHDIPKSQWVLWFDFEKFNKEIIEKKREAVERGYTVVFVDKRLVTHKDINAIVQNSSNPKSTLQTLFSTAKVLSGTRAKIEMSLNDRML
jgi:hypothetical protein